MPTAKPRITITLEPRAYEVLRRLSAAGGESMSTLVTEFLDLALPPMERMVVVLEQAKGMSETTKQQMRVSLAKAEAKLLPAVIEVVGQTDLFLTDMLNGGSKRHDLGAAEPRPDRADLGASTPVPVNTGVRSAERTITKRPRAVGKVS